MAIYLTDPRFFSDAAGLSDDPIKVEQTLRPDLVLPEFLTCTYERLPSASHTAVPAVFVLDEEAFDKETSRFTVLFQEMLRKGYAIFHIQISTQNVETMSAVFENELHEILLQYSEIDQNRLYIGGFGKAAGLLLYITGHSRLFRAAFSLNAFVNHTTAYGNCENSHETFLKSGQPDYKSWLYAMAEQCPLRFIDNNTAPYLIMHGHRDHICPEEQSEELFSAIKDRTPEVPCRMVIFPEENHDILKTNHQVWQGNVTEEILHWFEIY